MIKYSEVSSRLEETYKQEAERFDEALINVQETQTQKLLEIIKRNSETSFGKAHHFEEIKDIVSFRDCVPISTYEDYIEYVEEIKKGVQGVLTSEKIILLEPTSGSTSASKFIPYTDSLMREFQAGIFPWLYNLMQEYPSIKNGSLYWSITPATHQSSLSESGIKIGFGDDTSYFKPEQSIILSKLTAVPFTIASVSNIEEFKKKTLVSLLGDENLAFISVWNPTFFSNLLREFEKSPKEILNELKDRKRGKRLIEFYQTLNKSEFYKELWPKLALISSWTEGNALNHLSPLRERFSNVKIQGKGLISTESFVSFPYNCAKGNILSINSHFFEFKSLESGKVFLPWEVKEGKEYEVIITTSGGLYRYNIQDIVEVTGFYKNCPLLKFKGRNNNVSDLFGEKLNEQHINQVLTEEFKKKDISPGFFMLAPEELSQNKFSYTLFIENGAKELNPEELDKKLRENFHYDYCRNLGQLGKLRIFEIDSTQVNPEEIYLEENQERGIKLGDIKPKTLDSKLGWSKKFPGKFRQ